MADDQTTADVADLKTRMAEMERRMEFHDGQMRISRDTAERVMTQAKAVSDSAQSVMTAQQQVTAAKTAFDRLADRVDAVETKVDKIDDTPAAEPAKT